MEPNVKYILVLVLCSDGSVREAIISHEQRAQVGDILMQTDIVRVSDVDLSEVIKIDESKLK